MEQSEVTGGGSALRAAVAALRAAAEAALREPGSVAFNSEVPALLLELAAVEAQVAAVSLRVIAQAQQRGLPAAEGATSLAVWLRHLLRLSPRDAGTLARLAEGLDLDSTLAVDGAHGGGAAQPDTGAADTGVGVGGDTDPDSVAAVSVGAALRQGRVSLEHAGVMARTLGMVDALPGVVSARTRAEAEAFLIGQALQLGPDRVAVLGRYLVDALDQAGGADLEARERSQHAARAFTAVLDYAGMLQLRGSLPKEAGALLLAVLDPLAAPQPADDGTRDPRTATQRRADALIELAKLAAASGGVPVQGGNRACVLVTMTLDALQDGIDQHEAAADDADYSDYSDGALPGGAALASCSLAGERWADLTGGGSETVSGAGARPDTNDAVLETTPAIQPIVTAGGDGGPELDLDLVPGPSPAAGGERGTDLDKDGERGAGGDRGADLYRNSERAAGATGDENAAADRDGDEIDPNGKRAAGASGDKDAGADADAHADLDMDIARAPAAGGPGHSADVDAEVSVEGGFDVSIEGSPDGGSGVDGPACPGGIGDPGAAARPLPPALVSAGGGRAATLLPSGQPLSAAAARRIACDADLIPVVLGSEGQVLDIGRATRQWTWAQQKAVAVRDQGCIAPGCDRPPGWSQIHHIRYWSQHGTTGINNAAMLCDTHHDSVHHHGWTITMGEDGHPRMHPPAWLPPSAAPPRDPHQRWRRHLARIAHRHHEGGDTDKPDDGTG